MNECISFLIFISMFLYYFPRNYYKNIILIRFHRFTKNQYKRFSKWKNKSYKKCIYIYLTDVKCLKNKFSNLYYISKEDVIAKYPSLNDTGRCRNKRLVFYMWLFHLEHIMMCVKLISKKYIFDYLWILEQDIGYSGNINDFFKKYDKKKADLISTDYFVNTVGWYYCCTKDYMNFRNLYLKNKGYKTSEHIQRWSRCLINKINKVMKENKNIHSLSEHATIEYTLIFNLTFQKIYETDIGYKFSFNTAVSKKEWFNILKNTALYNKLFHSLKF